VAPPETDEIGGAFFPEDGLFGRAQGNALLSLARKPKGHSRQIHGKSVVDLDGFLIAGARGQAKKERKG
jgi:hypothetical protein